MLSTLFFILIIVVEHIVETAFSRQLESKPRNYLHVLYQTYCVNLRTVFICHAEDGIRDATVTGVQTCALPICLKHRLLGLFLSHVSEWQPGPGDRARRLFRFFRTLLDFPSALRPDGYHGDSHFVCSDRS